MPKSSGRTRTFAGHVRFVREAMRRAGPDGHGQIPLGMSGCPAADGEMMSAVRHPPTLTVKTTTTVIRGSFREWPGCGERGAPAFHSHRKF